MALIIEILSRKNKRTNLKQAEDGVFTMVMRFAFMQQALYSKQVWLAPFLGDRIGKR